MKAIFANSQKQLIIKETKIPQITEEEVLVKIHYAGINRADLLQKNGLYPPPVGVTNILGLEFAGEIVEIGTEVNHWKIGDQVCTIVAGGTYAEFINVHHSSLIPIPSNISISEAAALPEAFLTAFQSLVTIAKLKANEKLLIHAGASGVGSAAIQLAKHVGAEVLVTASAGKHEYCIGLGADECIDYKTVGFEKYIIEKNMKVDVILDLVGGSYFNKNLKTLALEGRMVMLGFLGGVKSEAGNVSKIVTNRLKIVGSTLRSRSVTYKAKLCADFQAQFMPADQFPFKINLDKVFDFDEVEKAHQYMEENKNRGKIVIKI